MLHNIQTAVADNQESSNFAIKGHPYGVKEKSLILRHKNKRTYL